MIATRATFGRYQFDVTRRMLFRDGQPVPLGRRALLLLEVFVRRRGDIVTKAELIEAAWPEDTVEESNLSVQVSQLRRLIGAHWILTIERVGYRFIAEPDTSPALDVRTIGLPSLAVLPFADLSTDGEHRRLADGLVEDLTTALARFKSLAVAARNASFQYDGRSADIRRAASDLGVRYILEGSIRRSNAKLRTSAQLIDGVTGIHLWAETFDTGSDQRVVEAVAAAVEAQIHASEIKRSRCERPDSREAYDFYLRARWRIQSSRGDDNAMGVALYRKALELEPDNVLYLAGAAEAFQHRTAVGWSPLTADDASLIRDYGRRALDQPDLDGVSIALVGNAMFSARDVEFGASLTDRGAKMNPNSPLALVCDGDSHLWVGSLDSAEAAFARSVALNPHDPTQRFAYGGLAAVHVIRGEYEDAIQDAMCAQAVSPGYSGGHWNLIASSALLGRLDDARRYLARYRAIAPEVTIESIRRGQPYADPSRLVPLIEGMRIAGLPEQ